MHTHKMNILAFGTIVLLVVLLVLLHENFVKADYDIKTKKLMFLSETAQCKREISFYEKNNSFFIGNNDNIYLEARNKKTTINSLNVYGTVHTNEYSAFQKEKQWTLYHLDTFDKKENSWTPSDISACGNSPDTFLGGPCIFGAVEAYTTIKDIPKHNELKIKLRVHFFDAWEGNSLFLQADKKILWTEAYNSIHTEKGIGDGINLCGKETSDRLSVPVDVEFQHSSGE